MTDETFSCDVLLLTVNENEIRQVLEAAKRREIDTRLIPKKFKSYYDLGVIGGVSVALVQSEKGSGTPGGSLLTTRDAQIDLNPRVVIAVGIAYGMNKAKQRLADILVSSQIFQYEIQRVGTAVDGSEEIKPRGDRVTPHNTGLLDRFRTFSRSWPKTKVHFGLILSGEKLIDNEDFLAQLRGFEPEAIGGEMEASGIYSASRGTPWIVVKAISDWADGTKNKRNKERDQLKAAEMAAEFVLSTLEQGGFPALFDMDLTGIREVSQSESDLGSGSSGSVAESAITEFDEFVREFPVFLPDGLFTFATALERGYLAERPRAHEILKHIKEDGSALIIGPPGSGKTSLALLAIGALQEQRDELGLVGARYLCTKPSQNFEVIGLLRAVSDIPLVILVDDVHNDEAGACLLYNEWIEVLAAGRKAFLIFTSQYYKEETDELRVNNFFHFFTRDIRSTPSKEEFLEYVKRSWWRLSSESVSDDALRVLTRVAKGSFGLANVALAVARHISFEKPLDHRELQKQIVLSVLSRYRVDKEAPDVKRALILGAYGVPISIEAFGAETAKRLLETGFLVPMPHRPGYTTLALRPVAELWESLEGAWVDGVDDLSSYIVHEASNYHEVLLGLQNADRIRVLSDVVNNNFDLLSRRIGREKDILRISKTLSAVAYVSHRLARLLLEEVLAKAGILRRIYENQNPKAILRFVSVCTYLDRRLLRTKVEQDAIGEILEKVFMGGREDILTVAELCNAVARSSSEFAKRLVASAIHGSSFDAYDTRTEPANAKDLLTFAGSISWFSRQNALALTAPLDTKVLVQILLSSSTPREARRILHSIAMLSHKKVMDVLKNAMNRSELDTWLQTLVSPPVNLFALAELLEEVSHRGKKLGARFAKAALPYLRNALKIDSRLPALGYLLMIARQVNRHVAEDLLREMHLGNRLNSEFLEEASPLRFGLAVLSVARLDKRRASALVLSLGDHQWESLINAARNLSEIAVLIRALAESLSMPDAVVARIVGKAGSLVSFRRLSAESSATDLANFASIVSVSCPLSWEIKARMLEWVNPERFMVFLRNERDTRKAGIILRSFAAAYPREAESFTSTLAESPLIKVWSDSPDIASLAFLLQAAADLDGRLADALGREIKARGILNLLELESKPTRVAEFLFALAQVFSPRAREVTSKVYARKNLLEVIENCGKLTDIVLLLNAVRVSDREFFERWVAKALLKSSIRLEGEILPRVREESNLGVLAALIASFISIQGGKSFAQKIVNELDKEWIQKIAWLDNGITQDFQFIARLVSLDPSLSQYYRSLVQTLLGPRMVEVRGIRALVSCLIELYRMASAMSAPELRSTVIRNLPLASLKTTLSHSDDIVGLAVISFMLGDLRDDFAADLAAHARTAALAKVGAHRPFQAHLTLALTGVGLEALGDRRLADQFRNLHSLMPWEVGFVNWIWAQQPSRLGSRQERSRQLIQMPEFIGVSDHGTLKNELLEDLAARTGSNLRFAFLLAAARSSGMVNPLSEHALLRERWEARNWVRKLIREFSTAPAAGNTFARWSRETVALCVRELAPRIEAVGVEEVEQVKEEQVIAVI